MTIKSAYSGTYNKLAIQCFADSFVIIQTLILRINIYGENRQLPVAASLYQQLCAEFGRNPSPQRLS